MNRHQKSVMPMSPQKLVQQRATAKFAAAIRMSLLGFLAVLSIPAHATVTFNFDALANNASNSSAQTYMRNILASSSAGTVTITGAQALTTYNGDNHVVGPQVGSMVSSETLGTSDGGVHHSGFDTFLANNGPTYDRISMVFSQAIYGVSFDYEIFPDGTCVKQSTSCQPGSTNWPDFSFIADNQVMFKTLGIVPGQSGTSAHSPISGLGSNELAPQYLGLSGQWDFINGVTTLEFVDWPAKIGIDNLNLNFTPPSHTVAEPSSLLLAMLGLVLLGYRRGRNRQITPQLVSVPPVSVAARFNAMTQMFPALRENIRLSGGATTFAVV